MKKLVARIVSEILYCTGDIVSRPMLRFDWAWLYPLYNKLMNCSYCVQIWACNSKPWIKNEDEN